MLRDVGSYICCATLVVMHAAARMRRMPTTCHHASFIDTLPLTNQRGLRSIGWEFKTCHCPVATGGIQMSRWHSNVQWQQVATGGNMWQQVASSHVHSRPVTSSGNRCLLVAVRSHFGLRLGGQNNPDRASNQILGRRICLATLIVKNSRGEDRVPRLLSFPIRTSTA